LDGYRRFEDILPRDALSCDATYSCSWLPTLGAELCLRAQCRSGSRLWECGARVVWWPVAPVPEERAVCISGQAVRVRVREQNESGMSGRTEQLSLNWRHTTEQRNLQMVYVRAVASHMKSHVSALMRILSP
jgi:hypothetical protein